MLITKEQIARIAGDGWGNWHAWVTVSPSEAIILKFKRLPTPEDIISAAANIVLPEEKPIDQLQLRLEEINRQLNDLQAEKQQLEDAMKAKEKESVLADF